MTSARPYDIVLLGATGFTGRLTAAHLAEHLPNGARWALAGRNSARLQAVRDELAADHPGLDSLPVIEADSHDPESLRSLASATRVVVSTVGPYLLHGEDLVAACAAEGTDYVDLTGEPEFVDRMYVEHDATARGTGARIVNACGFDAVPVDIATYLTAQALPDHVPVTLDAYITARATFSAGTYHSALIGLSRPGPARAAYRARRAAEPSDGRRVRAVAGRPFRSTDTGRYAVPLPLIDAQVAARTARALPAYGPDVRVRHLLSARRLSTVVSLAAGVAGLGVAVQVPALRRRLMDRMASGDGPDETARADAWFRLTCYGRGGGQTVVTTVAGGDPGYTETSAMLAESAISLAFDSHPPTSGVVTPVVAMGDRLVARLRARGLTIDVEPR